MSASTRCSTKLRRCATTAIALPTPPAPTTRTRIAEAYVPAEQAIWAALRGTVGSVDASRAPWIDRDGAPNRFTRTRRPHGPQWNQRVLSEACGIGDRGPLRRRQVFVAQMPEQARGTERRVRTPRFGRYHRDRPNSATQASRDDLSDTGPVRGGCAGKSCLRVDRCLGR